MQNFNWAYSVLNDSTLLKEREISADDSQFINPNNASLQYSKAHFSESYRH